MAGKNDLKDRVAVITGGARGIGYAIAQRFLASGAKVALWDMDMAALKDAKGSLQARGRVSTHRVELTREASVAAATAATLKRHERIDILVNNAGITGGNARTWELEPAVWRQVIEVNLVAPYLVCRAVVPHMLARKSGRIVNIASIAGKEGNPNASHYSASKAGLIGLTKSLGKELAQDGILVNCITPAAAKTDIFKQMKPEFIQFMLSKIPMGRFVEVDEIAAMAAWLASDDCSFSTGAVFRHLGRARHILIAARVFCRASRQEKAQRQPACKPGSVGPGLPGVTAIPLGRLSPAASSNQPGRLGPELPALAGATSLFGLAPGGACHARPVAGPAVRSYRTFSPLPHADVRRPRPGGSFSVALSLGSPPPDVIRRRCSVEPGLSSTPKRRGRPADWRGGCAAERRLKSSPRHQHLGAGAVGAVRAAHARGAQSALVAHDRAAGVASRQAVGLREILHAPGQVRLGVEQAGGPAPVAERAGGAEANLHQAEIAAIGRARAEVAFEPDDRLRQGHRDAMGLRMMADPGGELSRRCGFSSRMTNGQRRTRQHHRKNDFPDHLKTSPRCAPAVVRPQGKGAEAFRC